jgi:hypothetical protein
MTNTYNPKTKFNNMENFNVTFWKEPYNHNDSFVKDLTRFIASAKVSKSSSGQIDTFHIKLNDIGLNSLHGEFDIVRENGVWQRSDKDSAELNFLKWNIIGVLINEQ